jgi:hypothetical protein
MYAQTGLYTEFPKPCAAVRSGPGACQICHVAALGLSSTLARRSYEQATVLPQAGLETVCNNPSTRRVGIADVRTLAQAVYLRSLLGTEAPALSPEEEAKVTEVDSVESALCPKGHAQDARKGNDPADSDCRPARIQPEQQQQADRDQEEQREAQPGGSLTVVVRNCLKSRNVLSRVTFPNTRAPRDAVLWRTLRAAVP